MTQSASWDILTGVGFTALGVAAVRAMETHRPDGLVDDPYAESFVQAAHMPVPLPTRMEDVDQADLILWESQASYMGVRSKFFDTFFADASIQRGIDQVVLLAAGLDTRAFRLDWPASTTVYELDAAKVLQFKDQVLTEQGARPRCRRRAVAVDLRQDWPTALRRAGWDPIRPTAWLAEGLLTYLPDEAKDSLFTAIQELSVTGSAIAVEHFGGDPATLERDPFIQNIVTRFRVDITTLWPADQHYDPAGWLSDHGWTVSSRRATALAHDYGRPLARTHPAYKHTNFLSAYMGHRPRQH